MSHRLKVFVLVAGASLWIAGAPVSARPLAGTLPGQPPSVFASLWGSLASLWSAAGCEIDPNGARCVINHASTGPVGAHTGGGAGRLVNVRGAAGCEIDPDGARAKSPGPVCGASAAPGTILPQGL